MFKYGPPWQNSMYFFKKKPLYLLLLLKSWQRLGHTSSINIKKKKKDVGKPFHAILWKSQPLIKQNAKTKVIIMRFTLTWMVQLFKLYLIPCFLNRDSLVSGIIAIWIVISLFPLNWVFEEMLVDLWVCCSYLPMKYYIQIQQTFPHLFYIKIYNSAISLEDI